MDGVTGMPAASEEEWTTKLETLIVSETLRRIVGI
jgi:hypothetical protein